MVSGAKPLLTFYQKWGLLNAPIRVSTMKQEVLFQLRLSLRRRGICQNTWFVILEVRDKITWFESYWMKAIVVSLLILECNIINSVQEATSALEFPLSLTKDNHMLPCALISPSMTIRISWHQRHVYLCILDLFHAIWNLQVYTHIRKCYQMEQYAPYI